MNFRYKLICYSYFWIRAINIPRGDSEGPSTSSSEITLNVNHEGRDYRLRYNSNQTVKDVNIPLYNLFQHFIFSYYVADIYVAYHVAE